MVDRKVRSGEMKFDTRDGELSFPNRVLFTVAIAAGTVAIFLLLWQAANVFLLLFAGVLLAVVLSGAAEGVSRLTGIPAGWSLALVLVVLAALLGAGGWFLGSTVAGQFENLFQNLTVSSRELSERLGQYEWWPKSLQLPSVQEVLARQDNVFHRITGAMSATLGILANVLVVLFVGIFVAAQPGRHRAGVLHLVPIRHRDRTEMVLDTVGVTLRRWMVGQLLDMLLVGVLTTLGLYFLGIPAALALGILTGLLVFIPYLGPPLSAVPAILIALTQGPMSALYVALLYLGIQTVESYLFLPIIQDRSVDLPPAVVLGAQLLLGVLLGALGVVLATPLVATVVVVIQMLYVRAALGDPIAVKGETEDPESLSSSPTSDSKDLTPSSQQN